jgi:hypothetical protein
LTEGYHFDMNIFNQEGVSDHADHRGKRIFLVVVEKKREGFAR